MRITGVRLQNIACFEDLSLDFTNVSMGEAATWIVILGENGCGKSTLLQMISAGILGERLLSRIAGTLDLSQYVRVGTLGKLRENAGGIIKINLDPDEQLWIEDEVSLYPRSEEWSNRASTDYASLAVEFSGGAANPTYSEVIGAGRFACGFGSLRRIKGPTGGILDSFPVVSDSTKSYRFASMFGSALGMTDVPEFYRCSIQSYS